MYHLIERKRNASSFGLFLFLCRNRCSAVLIPCIYPVFCVYLHLSVLLFLSASCTLQSRGKIFTTNIFPKTHLSLSHAFLSHSCEPLEMFLGVMCLREGACYISYWTGSFHCLPFSIGAADTHQAQLAITHIMSAHEGEKQRRLRVSNKKNKVEGVLESVGCKRGIDERKRKK